VWSSSRDGELGSGASLPVTLLSGAHVLTASVTDETGLTGSAQISVTVCTTGTPAASDATCDGVDDDCDGTLDEEYASLATSCGVGACETTGFSSCVTGTVHDGCDPANTDDIACEDGNSCTTGDRCSAGSCQAGIPIDPNDGDVCTDDACDPGTGVVHTPADADADGTPNCEDGCPSDPVKVTAGICGCGVPDLDTDTDGDGTADCIDGCPADGTKTAPGVCGCGLPEVPGCGMPACSDGLDNDGDQAADYPADKGCESATDTSERGSKVCDNGLDDDADGYVDYPADPACKTAIATLEKTQCQDGLDNDGLTGIDFDGGASLDRDHDGFIDPQFNAATPAVGAPDPQCTAAWVNGEAAGTGGGGYACGLGPELAPLLGLLALVRRRRST